MENHADVENADAPEQSKNAAAVAPFIIFFFQSVVAAALFPIVLGSSDTVVVIWRLSLLLTYFYSAFCVLSPAAPQGKARIFICLTYAASMAFVIDAVLIHGVGTAIIYLDSVWMAGVFGHVLAGSATASSSSSSSSERAEQHRAFQEELKDNLGCIAMELVVFAALGLALVCIMDPDSAPKVAMGVLLPVPLCYSLTNAIICTLKPMRGAPGTVAILGMECDTTVLLCSFILPLMIYMCSLLLVGEVGAAVVLLFCAIGLSVLLGYCLSLQSCTRFLRL